MKHPIHSLLFLLMLGIGFTACKKEVTFDDGISGSWSSTSIVVNGTNVTSFFALDLNLKSSHNFNSALTLINPATNETSTTNYTGIWSADEAAETLTLTYDSNNEVEVYDILEKSDKLLKIEKIDAQTNDRTTYTLEKQ